MMTDFTFIGELSLELTNIFAHMFTHSVVMATLLARALLPRRVLLNWKATS